MRKFPTMLLALLIPILNVRLEVFSQINNSASDEKVPVIAKAIYGNISVASTTKQQALILLNPSLSLELSLKSTEIKLQENADSLPEPEWIFQAKKENLHNILTLIAEKGRFAKGGVVGNVGKELTEAELLILFVNSNPAQPTDAYNTFLELNQRIADATLRLKTETDTEKKSKLQLERSEASLRLAALPDAESIGRADRKLQGLGKSQAAVNRNRLLKFLQTYRGPRFVPAIDKWADSSGWVHVETTLNSAYDAAIFTAEPSNLTPDWWSPQSLDQLLGRKVTKLSFDIKRVLIDRPGLDLSLFEQKNWKFDDATIISDGQLLINGSMAKGEMPLLTTGFLLSRNIVLTTISSPEAKNQAISASQHSSFRFGTLSLGGSYLGTSTTNRFYPAFGFQGITSPEIQIIALICNQLPKSPDPDPTLKW